MGVDLQSWQHHVDQTKLDGSHIYPSSITTDKLAANSVTAAKILTDNLSAISAYLGNVVAGSVTGTTILGATIRTASVGRYLQMDEDGLKMTAPGGAGTCGTTANGGSEIKVGTTANLGDNYVVGAGMLGILYDIVRGIPLNIKSEQPTVGDLHLFPRSSDPSTGEVGDIALVNNKLRVCTATTPTWADAN